MERPKQNSCGMTRREFAQLATATAMGLAGSGATSAETPKTKMFKNLNSGMIGISANQSKEIGYAAQFGFQGVNVHLDELETLSETQRNSLREEMKSKGICFGSSGLPVEFRKGEEDFKKGISALSGKAKVLKQMGVSRVSTWVLSGSNELTYLQYFNQLQKRLGEAARILKGEGVRLGLEFLGPRTILNMFRYPFAHTQKEMLELCDAIGTGNVGLLLDAWHWHTSHGTLAELNQLTNDQIVDVHVNDAPKGVPIDELVDNRRALPGATGVIDLKGFMLALVKIGYDGPVTIEPFDQELAALETETKLKKTADAMNRLFALIQS